MPGQQKMTLGSATVLASAALYKTKTLLVPVGLCGKFSIARRPKCANIYQDYSSQNNECGNPHTDSTSGSRQSVLG